MTELTPKTDDRVRSAALKAGFGPRDIDDLHKFLFYWLAGLEAEMFESIAQYYEVYKPADDAPAISELITRVLADRILKP